MEIVQGGSNMDNVVCGLSTIAWAAGALLAPTGFGLVLWGIGGLASLYCINEM